MFRVACFSDLMGDSRRQSTAIGHAFDRIGFTSHSSKVSRTSQLRPQPLYLLLLTSFSVGIGARPPLSLVLGSITLTLMRPSAGPPQHTKRLFVRPFQSIVFQESYQTMSKSLNLVDISVCGFEKLSTPTVPDRANTISRNVGDP